MIILGIDPGTTRIGFGVIESAKNHLTVLDYGIISTPGKDRSLDYKLISEGLSKLIAAYKPERAGVEKLFFSKNLKTVMSVSEARGVIMLTLANHGIPIMEPAPQQVKQAVSAYGSAGKAQVERMVRLILKIQGTIKPDDAADALAIAICAANNNIY
ncbi:MAG: crossover junction endodeoxyribonuclease RuvC [Candidatus Yanofskybacteria bacterium]|nr:crossover junction endodeoxyribonuclease RuvC [Candidatus Yanofskybacteria bacterium]